MRNKNGFTLLEVITAIAVVAIISGPLLQIFVTSSRVSRGSYDIDQANAAAVATVEGIIKGDSEYSLSDSTYYYDSNWEHAASESVAAFSAEVTLTSVDAGSGGVELSYIPELICHSGENSGSSYRITANYATMSSGEYNIDITSNSANYTINTTSFTLISSLTGVPSSTIQIPKGDCVSGIIPIVVDVGSSPLNKVKFNVNNLTGLETGIYVYGDYSSDPAYDHFVTATLSSGTMSINYMKRPSSSLDYDNLDVNVKVIRRDENKVLADYTTKIYAAH